MYRLTRVIADMPMIADEHRTKRRDFSSPLRSATSERSAVGSHLPRSAKEPLSDLRILWNIFDTGMSKSAILSGNSEPHCTSGSWDGFKKSTHRDTSRVMSYQIYL